MKAPGCDLCGGDGGRLIVSNEFLRVVLVDDVSFPGFTRVVWNEHIREMSDLGEGDIRRLMHTVFAVERALREVLAPDKINLASLGNVTPHLHWHVIPRYRDDSHFPQPVWGEHQRETPAATLAARRERLPLLRCRIAEEVARVPGG